MGYSTDFEGQITIDPILNIKELKFLTRFADTRRMDRKQGPYYVDHGRHRDGSGIIDVNRPPKGQPGLWCQWAPTEDGDALVWDGGEKFYYSSEWMVYLIQHFLCRNPLAKKDLPFLQGHILNGTITAQGDDPDDKWFLHVKDNRVTKEGVILTPAGNEILIGSGD